MKNTLQGIRVIIGSVAAASLPLVAGAQTLPAAPFVDVNGLKTFICTTLVGWMFTFFIILAVILVLIAAYYFLTSGGDAEKAKAGSDALIYFAVAIVIALLARGIPLIVGTFVGGNTNVGC